MKAFKNNVCIKIVASLLCAGIAFSQLSMGGALALDGESPADTSASSAQGVVQNPGSTIKGHKLIAQNDNYQLYFKEESLSVIIRDKKTGSIMESVVESDSEKANETWMAFMKSGVVLQVLNGINVVPTTADIRKAQKKVTLNDKGFSAEVYYDNFKIGYTLNVSLDKDGFTAEIPSSSIKEDSDQFKIGEVYIYPFLGHTKLGERQGYMLIPDGNGAIINLEDNEGKFAGTSFSEYVYGKNAGVDETAILSLFRQEFQTVNDSEKIIAPVFGMVHTDSKMACLGVIESGQYSAKIEAYPNSAYTDFNWITSKFILRQIYNQPTSNSSGSILTRQKTRNEFDIRVRYLFADGEDANYTGLAIKYRNYLLGSGLVSKKNDDFKIRLDFLGTDKENWLLFKKTVAMTTEDNIREMVSELENAGVEDILAVYKGWQKGGINALPITSYSADRAIGGTSGLTSLVKELGEKGIDLYLAQDALRINPDTNNTTFSAVKKITKRVYEEDTYKKVFTRFNFLMPDISRANLEKTSSQYLDKGIKNIMLSGITDNLFTYTYRGEIYSRVDTAKSYEGIVSDLSKNFNLALEQPFSYLWQYAGAIIDMPVGSSDYTYVDKEVPFLSIALKGIIPMYGEYANFEANKNEFFLNLVEMGINPSFYITYEDPAKLQNTNSSDVFSSQFRVYKDNIIKYYNELKAVHEKVAGATITRHESFPNGLVKVAYSNGIKIYVNYGDAPAMADGLEIEAMSYKVGEVK
ncbi:MAG: hypothetical protein JG769_1810 [Oscillospiraceae bacterium]|nr:hypothetical protein [Oscillospiraceae bacterium]